MKSAWELADSHSPSIHAIAPIVSDRGFTRLPESWRKKMVLIELKRAMNVAANAP
ncbi:hypothetical protein RESH_02850 [Rhodopirellula europaea SH398]|uniref:Uncharacterized protein n=1 Tax=Rhodopirellula europaea SH398 TaxID=1263868 RepID=M5S501_9BACT|nr:hypothetical protein RESH_02850 [Rhodopirellula europaea SH398]